MSEERPGRSLRLVLRAEGSRRTLFALAALVCLFIYLWPALAGPVVLWSDSRIDLDWAAKGAGILDTIQKSSRHKSGFALRFPRIVRIREDKLPAEATTLEEVEELYKRLGGS